MFVLSVTLPIASASAALWLALAVVVGSFIVGGTAFYFMRARFQERIEAPRATNLSSSAAPVPIQAEVRAIGQQIDRAMKEQRLQGETQRQILSQKLDSVRQSVESQRNQVDGLRKELRHEIDRRNAEMTDIKHQIAEIRTGTALPPAPVSAPALLPAPDAPPPAAPPAEGGPAPEAAFASPAGSADAAPGVFEVTFEDVSFGAPAEPAAAPDAAPSVFEEVSFDAAPAPPTFEDVSFDGFGPTGDAPATLDAFADVPFASAPESAGSLELATLEAATAIGAAAVDVSVAETWAPGPETAWVSRPSASAPAAEPEAGAETEAETEAPEPVSSGIVAASAAEFFGGPAQAPPDAEPIGDLIDTFDFFGDADGAAEPVPFEGADDLTVLSSVEEPMQQLLYAEGVRRLDEIAGWGRAEARRISAAVGVTEELILSQWVVEAQAALHRPFGGR